jgi:hypothetical protein
VNVEEGTNSIASTQATIWSASLTACAGIVHAGAALLKATSDISPPSMTSRAWHPSLSFKTMAHPYSSESSVALAASPGVRRKSRHQSAIGLSVRGSRSCRKRPARYTSCAIRGR